MSDLTQGRLRTVLHYSALTGIFVWRRPKRSGRRPGRIDNHGYRYIHIDGDVYKAANLAWFYVHGQWPSPLLDHINGKRDDDRIENLREATRAENNQNRKMDRRNTSGYRGVSKRGDIWVAQLNAHGVIRRLGKFTSAEEASHAYLAARAIAFPFQPIPRECELGV